MESGRRSTGPRAPQQCVVFATFLALLLPLCEAAAQSARSAPTLSGRLTTPDGQPVPDVRVTLYSGVATRFRGQRATTDENGQFSFDPLRTGARLRRDDGTAYRFTGVQFDHPSFVPADGRSWRDVEVAIKGGAEALDLVMTPGGTIEGVVADRDSGAPIADLGLRVHNGLDGSSDTGTFLVYATTNEQGAFRAGPVLPGEYFVEINDADYRGELRYPRLGKARVTAGEAVRIELVDRPMPARPEPIARAEPTPRLRPSGVFNRATTPPARLRPGPQTFIAREPDPNTATVTDEDGAPVSGANVLVASRWPDGRSRVEAFLTDSRGEFLLEAEPDAKCRLRVAAGGFLPLTTTYRRPELLRKLTTVRPTPGYGVVRLPDGGPIGARLYRRLEKLNKNDEPTFMGGVGDLLATTSTKSGLGGRFALNELPDAASDVIVEAVDGNRVVVRRLSPVEGVQIVLPERRDFVVTFAGDIDQLRAAGGKPSVVLAQLISMAGEDGVQREVTVEARRPIETRNGKNLAIFHGLIADASDPTAELDLLVGVRPETPNRVPIERLKVRIDGPQGVTLD